MTLRKLAVLALFATAGLLGCSQTQNPSTGSSLAAASGSAGPVIDRILARGELLVGTTGDMPPLNMTTKDGKLIGMEPELASWIAELMGVDLKLAVMPFAHLLPALEAGEIDMIVSGMTMTPERNLRTAFVGPYFTSGKCILSKEKTLAEADDAQDLNRAGTTLAALADSTSQKFIEARAAKAKLITAPTTEQAVQLVLDDKADALIADYNICVVSLVRHADQDLVTVISLLSYEPIGIALPPNDPLLINWMENFIARLQATGQLEALRKRWLEDDFWIEELP